MSNEKRTPRSDPSGEAVGGGSAQPKQTAEDKVSEREDFAKKAGLAAIGGALSGTFRVVAASLRDALLGDSGTD